MTTAPPDLDALIANGEIESDADAQRDARMRALWREADWAIRTDVGIVIELAKASNAAYAASNPTPEELEARRERGRAAARARSANRAARAAQDSTPATV